MSDRVRNNPFESLRSAIAFSSMDWAEAADVAWVYGIVFGWDDADDPESGAMDELAQRFGWTPEAVERLRHLHGEFDRHAAAALLETGSDQ